MLNPEHSYTRHNDDSLPLRVSMGVRGLGKIRVYGSLLDGIVFTRTRPAKQTRYEEDVSKLTAKGRAERAWGMTTPSSGSKQV